MGGEASPIPVSHWGCNIRESGKRSSPCPNHVQGFGRSNGLLNLRVSKVRSPTTGLGGGSAVKVSAAFCSGRSKVCLMRVAVPRRGHPSWARGINRAELEVCIERGANATRSSFQMTAHPVSECNVELVFATLYARQNEETIPRAMSWCNELTTSAGDRCPTGSNLWRQWGVGRSGFRGFVWPQDAPSMSSSEGLGQNSLPQCSPQKVGFRQHA